MLVNEKLQALRELMKEKGMNAYVIPSFDAHQSEYVPEHWKSRAWISGFTGSAGTVVVTLDKAGLWTDGRYFIQAERELKGTGIKLFKMRQPGVPTYSEWVADVLKEGDCLGFDGKVFSCNQAKELEGRLKNKNITIDDRYDLIDLIWRDRPELPLEKVYIHEEKYSGKSTKEKLNMVREEMNKKGAGYYLLSSLDDIAWLFNIRGNDVRNNPVTIAYAIVSMDNAAIFIDSRKVTDEVRYFLKENGVDVKEYEEIGNTLKNIDKGLSVFYDPNKISRWLHECMPKNNKKVQEKDIVMLLKTIKNETEIENLRKCHVKDSVAMVKFLYWLDNTINKEQITEISATDKLEGFRKQQEGFIGTSFDTIAAYKDHAAMMHYKATEENQYTLGTEGMFLVDSGGQYLDGTTDITRTIVLGKITEEEKRDFTYVLKGHIALCRAKFLHGVTGTNLDVLARLPLWEQGIDYKCGTGHGVGFLLSVHEAPQRFSIEYNDTRLDKGMVITNEPGVYKEGKHGIRTENVLLVAEDQLTDSGQFMKFEVLSYCPIDLDGVESNLLTDIEKDWLNNYHKDVYEKLYPYLNDEEKEWLKRETREI
ncbi:aminopeptidase P family protein [Proteiniborus sp. MB09-C3]|uniref:aminopeptidase P family protein n=1 Tax=Proteiniborus sp. MB09-C3 TaxID=3050072 RepID=UPI00255234F6|nr:aminopeptidase P family protein [Proteiniborus sp. MB09-C3]WIV12329.1 aminopeptidase P family protein [Proteiniborus sp. MB09-C3]